MAKTFGGIFPGQAPQKGNAQVVEEDFEPGVVPVDLSELPDEPPVEPETGAGFDPFTGLPLVAFNAAENQPLDDDDLPDQVPDFLFG